MEPESNNTAKGFGIGTLLLAAAGIWLMMKVTSDDKKEAPKKSKAASEVLQLMDKDHEYQEALKIVLKKRKYLSKKKLEKELDLYI